MSRTTRNRFAQNRDVLSQLGGVAATMKHFRHASEVLTTVSAVPTIFPQYDIATRVMGHPIARFCRLRGPSNEGKTTFMIGLMLSFLQKGHFVGFADAERTTPPEWLGELMGDYKDHPAFLALPVTTYEATVDAVRDYCETIANARDRGDIPEETSGIICIDSIRKLVPKNLLKTLMTEGSSEEPIKKKGRRVSSKSKGVDGFGGRAAQMKAALNAAWSDELIPLLANTKCAMLIIARETEDPNADQFSEGLKVGGGSALFYDASLDIRVTRSFITDEADKRVMLGERHRIEIRKTKIGRKELKTPFGYFHTSNGIASPVGFDRARDVLELAKEHDVVKGGGGSYRFDSSMFAKGEDNALQYLRENPDFMQEVELEARRVASSKWVADGTFDSE